MKKIYFIASMILLSFSLQAQEEVKEEVKKESKVSFDLGADLVSSYVWRGAYQTSAAIQPAMGLNIGGFSISAWGSIPFSGGAKEADLTVGYEIGGFSVAVTDYWWAGEGAYKYFEYSAHKTEHHFEASLGYTLPIEKFPLSLSWNTLFAGEDYYKADGDRAYSTYISATYPFVIKSVDLEVELGFTPWEGMYADDFAVVSVGLKAMKELEITDRFSLPLFAQLLANPKAQDIFFVFGLSF